MDITYDVISYCLLNVDGWFMREFAYKIALKMI